MLTGIPQYSLSKILLVWAAAAIPMAILGWIVAPALALHSDHPVFVRLAVLTAGLVWQFVLVMSLLYREIRTLQWSIVKERLWLNAPRSPETGVSRDRLWWWLLPVVTLTAIFDLRVKAIVDHLWVSVFPFLAEPPGWSLGGALAAPEAITHGALLFALPSRYFRSAWFGIAAHSGQSIFFAVLMLGLMLGLA